jgi:hypothetical protein
MSVLNGGSKTVGEARLQNGEPLEHHSSECDRGLVLLQIDGLSYGRLKEAMDKGYAPNLKKVVNSGDYKLEKYFSGLPSVTVPIMCAMFYGIPLVANSWYDIDSNRFVDSIKEETTIQKKASAQGEHGLLADGTSYSSPITGGSGESYFNVSQLQDDLVTKGKVKTLCAEAMKDLRLAKHGHHSILKMTYHFLKDFSKVRNELKAGGQFSMKEDGQTPFLIAMDRQVIPAIATQGVKESIDRGLPITFVDYAACDEVSHYYGNHSPQAFDSIRIIDEKIGEIFDHAKSGEKPYDIVVFSDHGQTDSSQFCKVYGKPMQDVVVDMAKQCSPGEALKDGDIVVSPVFSLAGIYFDFTEEEAYKEDIDKKFPGLIDKITAHPSVGFSVSRLLDKSIVIAGKDGSITVKADGTTAAEGKDPLSSYGDSAFLAQRILDYTKIPKTGDVLIFGAYQDGKVMDFGIDNSMKSVHGGLGGDQVEPFLIYQKDVDLHPEKITDPIHLHEQFEHIKKDR